MYGLKSMLKVFRNIVIFFICLILLLSIIYPQLLNEIAGRVYSSLSRTTYFRDSSFDKYTKGDQNVYFLGTVHSMSLNSKNFSYLNLKAVIENLKPDLLLIESRPEQLANNNFADGPGEMLYSHLTALNCGIPVKGVDWWTPDRGVPNSTNAERDEHINRNILKEVAGHKKVLILMGKTHLKIERPKLQAAGYNLSSFSKIEKDNLFEVKDNRLLYPKGMNYYIQKRISYEKSCIGTVYKTDIWRNQAKIIIKELEEFSKVIKTTGEIQ